MGKFGSLDVVWLLTIPNHVANNGFWKLNTPIHVLVEQDLIPIFQYTITYIKSTCSSVYMTHTKKMWSLPIEEKENELNDRKKSLYLDKMVFSGLIYLEGLTLLN